MHHTTRIGVEGGVVCTVGQEQATIGLQVARTLGESSDFIGCEWVLPDGYRDDLCMENCGHIGTRSHGGFRRACKTDKRANWNGTCWALCKAALRKYIECLPSSLVQTGQSKKRPKIFIPYSCLKGS